MFSAQHTEILAITVLAALALAAVLAVVYTLRRMPYTMAQSLLLTWSKFVTRVLWRAEISGRLPIAPGEGAVIISNHRCPFDPAFIALGVGRVMHWMVAREYCDHPVMGKFLRPFEPIPTNRGGVDTAATKLIIRYAQQGEIVGLFPEGRINATDRLLLPGRPGVAMIALKAQVPVIPCYIDGSPYDGTALGCLLMPAKVRLVVGRPIDLSPYYGREIDRALLEELTRRFMREIAALAGCHDYEPEMAGRFYKPGGNGGV